ncbi:MAG: putative transposase [Paracoccaceae bacterium]|jgi:putative transposase
MSSYIRPRRPGATIFFSVALAERGSTLLVDQIDRLRSAVGLTRRERPFHVDAWVVLPDHMLCIWTLPANDADFSRRWGAIKSRFSRGLPSGRQRGSHGVRREKGVWQRRFWEHHIRGVEDYADHMRFCWSSPVRQGLVPRPEDWEFSSIHRDIREGRYGVLDSASCAVSGSDKGAQNAHPAGRDVAVALPSGVLRSLNLCRPS